MKIVRFVFMQKKDVGLLTIIGLFIVPLVIWVFMKPLYLRFLSTETSFASLGEIAGLFGIMGISIVVILSARLKFLEDYFGGYDRVYSIHHTLGVISFLALLIHPISLALQYAQVSVIDAAWLFIPSSDVAITLGIISLLLMMIVLSVTMFAHRFSYRVLKTIHSSFGAALLLGGVHGFLVPSDISRNSFMKFYVIGIVVIALGAYAYRTLLGRWLVKRHVYGIEQVNTPVPGVTEVVLLPVDKRINHKPGQFVFVSFDDPNVFNEPHPFSISSAPHEDVLRLTIKGLGDFTSTLGKLSVGSHALIEGPFGQFVYSNHENKHQIWIAGGVGVTPFLDMARDLCHRKPEGYSVDFFYTVRNAPEALFYQELSSMSDQYNGFRFIPYFSDGYGFLNAQAVATMSGGLFGKEIFVCGPPPMMNRLVGQFTAGGVSKKVIHFELFKML